MRGRVAVTFICVLTVLTAGCTGRDKSAASPPSPAPSSAPASSAPATTPAPARTPEDVVPALVNPAGSPPCGLFTYVREQSYQKVTYLGLAVAVAPRGTFEEVRVAYQIEGETTRHSATFKNALLNHGESASVGTAATYLRADVGILRIDTILYDKVAAFLAGPRTITVTVDSQSDIRESNENNNVMRLRVTPPRNKPTIDIADNRCTVL